MTEAITREQLPSLAPAPEDVSALFERTTPVDFNDLQSVAGAALRMPSISGKDLRRDTFQNGEGLISLKDVDVPLDRVVGIRSMPGWYGRGLDKSGNAKKNGEYSSLSGIAYYGKKGQTDEYSAGSAPHLIAFTDTVGEVWFMGYNDGSHRIAAAKLSGYEVLQGADVDWANTLPKVNFSVSDVLRARGRLAKSKIGNVVLRSRAQKLVQASIKLDEELAEDRRYFEGLGGEFIL